jgi:glucose-6-phosphate isomerase
MLRGEPVNTTEGRAVLHTALRAPPGAGALQRRGARGAGRGCWPTPRRCAPASITDIVNIGIGGSDLGPQMVVPALEAFVHPQLRLHFVSNVDGHDITPVLRAGRARTLFIVASKTFTTQETMANARWRGPGFGRPRAAGADIGRHFVATTTNVEAAARFGITPPSASGTGWAGATRCGAPSACRSRSPSGAEAFRELLAGAHAMDRHFAEAPLEANLPVQLGLLDVWYRNFHGFTSRSRGALPPGAAAAAGLPAAAGDGEQRQVRRPGGRAAALRHQPGGLGRAGTNGQHAYFQMLHQGTT